MLQKCLSHRGAPCCHRESRLATERTTCLSDLEAKGMAQGTCAVTGANPVLNGAPHC